MWLVLRWTSNENLLCVRTAGSIELNTRSSQMRISTMSFSTALLICFVCRAVESELRAMEDCGAGSVLGLVSSEGSSHWVLLSRHWVLASGWGNGGNDAAAVWSSERLFPLVRVLLAVATVLMEGTDRAGRRPCDSGRPCSRRDRCCMTFIMASFSKS